MWKCSKCSESVEDDFDICWNCGANKDGSPSANQAEFDAARSDIQTRKDERAENTLAWLGRKLGRSRVCRVFGAVAVMAFFFGLAYMVWRHREYAAEALILGLAFYGLVVAWRILPIPASTRARWAMEGQKGGYGFFFLCGIGSLMGNLLSHGISAGLERSDLIVPGVFFVIGLVRLTIVRRSIRQAESAMRNNNDSNCSGPLRHPAP